MLAELLYRAYAVRSATLRRLICWALGKIEKGDMRSVTLRRVMARYHDIHVGAYSYGGCFNPARIANGTRIGAYCSFAEGVYVFSGNHPYRFKSTHPLFFNPDFGHVQEELITRTRLTVGNDVWVGCNVIILPSVSSVGDGAVLGAGAVVTKDVPPFAIVAGNPARLVRYRFSPETIAEVAESRWWTKSIDELRHELDTFTEPVG